MQRVSLFALLVCGAICFTGCEPAETPNAALVIEDNLPKQGQPKLQTARLWLGPADLTAELALSIDQMRIGMMFRTNMAENEAMLFVFPQPFRASFWMKNTLLPLSAGYIAPDGTILEIHDLKPHDTNAVVANSDNIQFVIETTRGWFERHNVSTGMVVRGEHSELINLFQFHRRHEP